MKKAPFLIFLLVPIIFLLARSQAGAAKQRPQSESVTIAASKDNTLYEDSTGSLSNGSGEYFFAGRASNPFSPSSGGIRRGLIAFESLTAIPAGSLILSVDLTLIMSKTAFDIGAYPVSLHKVQRDWGEGTSDATGQGGSGGGTQAEPQDATWLHTFFADQFWQTAGGDFVSTPSATTTVDSVGSYTWSGPGLKSDVYSWFIDPDSNFGWVLLNESSSRTAKRFNSRENSTPEFQPKLVVTYLPPDQVQRLYLPAVMKK